MTRVFRYPMLAALLLGSSAFPISSLAMGGMAASKPAASQPAATQASLPACCGDACKQMGTCCTADAKGEVTCSMGGSCCMKADTKKSEATGGIDMGK